MHKCLNSSSNKNLNKFRCKFLFTEKYGKDHCELQPKKKYFHENRSQINKQDLNMCKILTTNINNFVFEVSYCRSF